MNRSGKYRILMLLLALVVMASCIKDPIVDCPDGAEPTDGMPDFSDGYSLMLKVTLDNMGGTNVSRADMSYYTPEYLKELENYIDPEKFRVLFFDRMDNFIFESKSRWIKLLDGPGEGSQWLVSVPIYPYGNDEDMDWEWEKIRRVLTGEDKYDKDSNGKYIYEEDAYGLKKDNRGTPYMETDYAFKIAILANRSEKAWNMGILGRINESGTLTNSDIASEKITPGGWQLFNGPNWTAANSKFGDDPKQHVTVFDLHHCQDDYIYEGKNYDNRSKEKANNKQGENIENNQYPQSQWLYTYYNIYDFITGPSDNTGNHPKLSAVSTWVDWEYQDNNKITQHGQTLRRFLKLTKDHPIPMYGIQEFAPLERWAKGTPFNVSDFATGQSKDSYDYKSISLLRSVVKLELVLPKDLSNNLNFIWLWYPNVYARCEPMDVWTPTNEIWVDDHSNKNCEWFKLIEHGPVASSTNPTYTNNQGSVNNYQKIMSWYYGVWHERGWKFDQSTVNSKVLDSYINGLATWPNNQKGTLDQSFPRIFNSCVQRNTAGVVMTNEKTATSKETTDLSYFEDAEGVHYIVYTGERNINDPSTLTDINNRKSGAPVLCYWSFADNSDNLYSVAITEFRNDNTSYTAAYRKETLSAALAAGGSKLGTPFGGNVGNTDTTKDDPRYEQAVFDGKANVYPWPLMRNHVYKLVIQRAGAASRGGDDFSVSSAEFHSESLKID